MECARMIQVECGHAMQHNPEFVHEDVGSVGFTISPDQPGSDGLAASKLRCAIVPTSSRSIGTPNARWIAAGNKFLVLGCNFPRSWRQNAGETAHMQSHGPTG